MWSALAYVTTGVSLVGFIAAVAVWLSRAALVRREELIQSASEKDRAKLIEASLESFRVSTSGLTREQKYQLAIEQIHARERRFKYLGSVVSLIAILVAALAAYAIAKTEIAAPTSGVPAEPTQITQRQPPPPQPPQPTSPFTDWQLVRHDEFASESGWWTGEQHDPKLQYFRVDVQGGRYRWALGIGDIPWDKFVPSPYPTAYDF